MLTPTEAWQFCIGISGGVVHFGNRDDMVSISHVLHMLNAFTEGAKITKEGNEYRIVGEPIPVPEDVPSTDETPEEEPQHPIPS